MFIALRRPRRNSPPGRLGFCAAVMLLASLWISAASAQQSTAVDNEVKDIKVSGADSALDVVIATTHRPDSSVFTLSSPARIVVDISDTLPGRFSAPLTINKGPVKDIAVKEFKDEGTITRITLHLDSIVDYTSEVNDNSITLHLKPRSQGADQGAESEDGDLIGAELAKMDGSGSTATAEPAEKVEEVSVASSSKSTAKAQTSKATVSAETGGVTEITGLDFLPYEKRSRVRISGARSLRYTVSPVNADKQVVVEISNATIPKKLRRALDTSEFPSAVKMISAYPVKGKETTVRVVVKLRESVTPKVEEDATHLFVDFAVPEAIAARMGKNPAGDQGAGDAEAQGGATTISANGQVNSGSSSAPNDGMAGLVGVTYEESAGGSKYSGRRISIDVREADLHNVFRMISNVSKLNIVAGDNVTGKVTVKLENVPWDQALAVILQSKGLGAVRFGNIIRIAPLSVLKDEQEAKLSAIKSAHNLEKLETLILPLNYSIAADIKGQIEAALTERGKLTLDSRTNALIIEDTPSGLAKAKALAASLDTATPQVQIEARIVEVSTTFSRNLGIQWGGDVNASPNTGANTHLYFPSSVQVGGGYDTNGGVLRAGSGEPNWVVDLPAAGTGGALALNLGSISDIVNIDARLSALEASGTGKVISSPKVMTVDNKEATVSQGTKIPYQSVSAAGTAVQFIEATLKLAVTPHITQDNRVFLRVKLTNNRPDFSQAVNGQPAIEVKEASTEVMVRDGETTVLGGVYTLNESESTSALPGLGKIPFLGWLFKSNTIRSDRKELLVFITPHVVGRNKVAAAG